MMSSSYNGCGSDISLLHAQNFHNGGQVTQHHNNEVRDTLGDLAYRDVNCERIVQEGGDGVLMIQKGSSFHTWLL